MAKSVQLSDDAYSTLAALERPGESFSDVVKRLAHARKDLSALRKLPPLCADFDEIREKMRKADLAKARKLLGR